MDTADNPAARAAISSISEKIGCTAETLRKWVRRAERDTGRLQTHPLILLRWRSACRLPTLSAEHILFTPVRHPDFVGAYDGPLFLVIDGGTASASEQFATLLQAHGAASVIGERSYGAGCGYTRGGIPLYLDNVGLRVWMPDCVRFRADGENELAGVNPDLIGWQVGARGKERARSLAAALSGALP